MPGKESNLPSRKVRKNLKKEGKVPQGRAADEYLLPKFAPASTDVSQRSPPVVYEPLQGQYMGGETPSPPRAHSFDGQPESLGYAAPIESRDASFDYSYGHGPRQNV